MTKPTKRKKMTREEIENAKLDKDKEYEQKEENCDWSLLFWRMKMKKKGIERTKTFLEPPKVIFIPDDKVVKKIIRTVALQGH